MIVSTWSLLLRGIGGRHFQAAKPLIGLFRFAQPPLSMRRFTRLTNGFSKKMENHKAAVALHFAHHNFVRLHRTIECSPAMAAGVSKHLSSVQELVERTTEAA